MKTSGFRENVNKGQGGWFVASATKSFQKGRGKTPRKLSSSYILRSGPKIKDEKELKLHS